MSNHRWRLPLLLFSVSLLNVGPALAADWVQWRGPGRDGVVADYAAPQAWPKELKQSWRVEVGVGHASPIVVGDAAYLFARIGEDECLQRVALADGKTAVLDRYPAPYQMHSAARNHGKGPKSTPVYAEGRLVTLGISGILSCYDLSTDKLAWRREFGTEFKKTSPLFGTAMSPLIDGDRVIAHVGGHDSGSLTAFNLQTGETVWHWDADGPGYASPIIVTLAGARQLVTQTQKLIIGLNVETGELLWSLPFTTPYNQNSVSPVLVGDLLVFAGTKQPTFAVRLSMENGKLAAEKVWQTPDAPLYMSTPVVRGELLYGMTERNKGQLFALAGTSGEVAWTGQGRLADNASLLLLGDQLAVLTTAGKLLVLNISGGEPAQLAEYQVADSPVWASAAISGKQLLVKDETHLSLWQLP